MDKERRAKMVDLLQQFTDSALENNWFEGTPNEADESWYEDCCGLVTELRENAHG